MKSGQKVTFKELTEQELYMAGIGPENVPAGVVTIKGQPVVEDNDGQLVSWYSIEEDIYQYPESFFIV